MATSDKEQLAAILGLIEGLTEKNELPEGTYNEMSKLLMKLHKCIPSGDDSGDESDDTVELTDAQVAVLPLAAQMRRDLEADGEDVDALLADLNDEEDEEDFTGDIARDEQHRQEWIRQQSAEKIIGDALFVVKFRNVRRCSGCNQPGHYLPTCPAE
jgi:hypothetical protein